MQLYLVAIASAFFAFTLILALHQLIFRKRSLAYQRIQKLFTESDSVHRKKIAKRQKEMKRERLTKKTRALLNIGAELSNAGIKLRVEEFVILWILCAFAPAAIFVLLGVDSLAVFTLCFIGTAAPIYWVRRRKTKRIQLLEQQLSQALIILTNCLQTGLSFQQGLESIVKDMSEPISKEFGRVIKEVQLGLSMEKALENLAERLGSPDYMMIASAILIQRQAGGNLSEVLQNISETIRERLKIKANLKVLTATGRTSGIIIGMLPVILMLILMVINPSYIRMFFQTSAGKTMLIVACLMEIGGFLVIRKIVSVKF